MVASLKQRWFTQQQIKQTFLDTITTELTHSGWDDLITLASSAFSMWSKCCSRDLCAGQKICWWTRQISFFISFMWCVFLIIFRLPHQKALYLYHKSIISVHCVLFFLKRELSSRLQALRRCRFCRERVAQRSFLFWAGSRLVLEVPIKTILAQKT